MVNAIAICGPRFKAPSYHELRGSMLQDVAMDIKIIIDEQQNIWRKKGYNILSDGWTVTRGRTLLNFLVSSSRGLVFRQNKVYASTLIKITEYLFSQLDEVTLEVGLENVQVNFEVILYLIIIFI